MFNLCKSRYQAVLLKQRWNDLNQQCAIYQTAGEKCVPSALDWNYWSYIFNDKSCSATIQRAQEAYDKKRADDSKEHPINVDPPWGLFTTNDDVFCRIRRTFLGQLNFTRNYFFAANTCAWAGSSLE